ncbi:glutamate racemase [Marinobacter sp. SS21]|uniref:glutamate racemase n=1 Tax=Marinobacter sp. SS21 TaxID=2979460 RepID=UPI0023302A16|nr:glutamate racemase [Marinobacter sp. SS21]MDC0662651.1 glutamate racemase [Marinobacter sp. SS21]
MNPPRILVFDSGVGGLSVAQCIHRALPSARLVYLADNACFPYGDQPEELVTARCLQLIEASLKVYPSQLIVVACNTASTVVLPDLRASTHLPVVGVVPAIKPAAAVSENRRIGLLATPATIRRAYLDRLVDEFAADCQLHRVGHPALVRWIEDWVAGRALPEAELAEVLAPFREAQVDTVVLGCTHYPLIGQQLQGSLPEVRHWVDSGEAIARRTADLLDRAGYLPGDNHGKTPALDAMLFSGKVPPGIETFLPRLGLATGCFRGDWPSETVLPTAIGSI